jgi:hypothetical protein
LSPPPFSARDEKSVIDVAIEHFDIDEAYRGRLIA